MDDRRDNAELKAAHPTLHAQYESLRAEVNRTVDNITDQIVQQVMVKRRPQAIKELENCIEDIQKLPNFGQFQRAPTAEQMKKASEDGNIVVINITDLRSDAIVISSIGFSAVPLPRLDASSAKGWINKDLTMPSSNDPAKDGKNNKIYRQFLSWLWQQCVKPIFQEAQYKPRPSMNRLPRVWWIGTGFASSFPFHAAGDSSTGPTESTYYWAVSSYTPSIKALIYARERTPATTLSSNNRRKLLVISMANTPDANGLPGVEKEKTAVVRALGNSVSVEVLEQPNVASVLHQIQQCTIAHFACHGVSNSSDPSESGLLLQTSATEPRQDILSVRKISQTHLAGGEIAYLSACSTAENRAASLVDEVLHVVSGFQVAGFRHVVGCLWPSSDSVCVEVAKSFYSEIRRGGMEWEDRAVAAALHKAVVKICESKEYSRRPLQWAQYVHYGA
jgi:CHAT domain-containing protein